MIPQNTKSKCQRKLNFYNDDKRALSLQWKDFKENLKKGATANII